MAKLSISMAHDSPALDHNRRANISPNVNKDLIENDVFIKTCDDIEKKFNEIFDESKENYNAKQKRADRKIDNYYKKVTSRTDDKAPKPVYEYVLQFGDMHTNNVNDPNAAELVEDCKIMLMKTVKALEEKFPNFVIISAVIHMDEQTPHAHIDFIPVGEGYKNGMEKQCSLTKALENMGYKNTTEVDSETGQKIRRLAITHWQDDVKNVIMKSILEAHGHERDYKNNTDKHASIDRAKQILENKKLVEKGEKLTDEIEILEHEKQMRIVDIEKIPPRPADIPEPIKPEKPIKYIGENPKSFHERMKTYKSEMRKYDNYPKEKAKREKEQSDWDETYLTAENLRSFAEKNESDRQKNITKKKELDEREMNIEAETEQRLSEKIEHSERLSECMKVSDEWDKRYEEIYGRTYSRAVELTRNEYQKQQSKNIKIDERNSEHEDNISKKKQNSDNRTTEKKEHWER